MFTDDARERPIVGVLSTASNFNPCHKTAPQVAEAVAKGVRLSFVVADRAWKDADAIQWFKDLARKMATQGLGRRIEVHLLDDELESRWHGNVDRE